MVPSEASVGVSSYFVKPYHDKSRIMAHVADADILYFARHPHTDARLRFYIPGESPVEINTPYVLVLRVGDHCYLRIPVDDALARRLSFLRPPSLSRQDWAA